MRTKIFQSSKEDNVKQQHPAESLHASPIQGSRGIVTSLLHLQRLQGNHFVQRMVTLANNLSSPNQFQDIQKTDTKLACKLAISQPGDLYEREADSIAEQVMSMPEPATQDIGVSKELAEDLRIQPLCPGCEEQMQKKEMIEQPLPEEQEIVQTKLDSGQDASIPASLESELHSLRGHGQPLPESARAFFEPRFGYNFEQARVHTDSRAAELARSVNALAFTFGNQIVFGKGQYSPDNQTGKKLLAHELTHVIQQGYAAPSLMRSPACNCPAVGGRDPTAAEKTDARRKYPRLVDSDWCVTGPATSTYNCIAWTIGVTSRWVWDEVDTAGDGNGDVSVADFDAFYDRHGLKPVQNQTPTDAEVALFGNSTGPTHAARRSSQACDGTPMFESKRGENIRILHQVSQLEGGFYGDIVKFYVPK